MHHMAELTDKISECFSSDTLQLSAGAVKSILPSPWCKYRDAIELEDQSKPSSAFGLLMGCLMYMHASSHENDSSCWFTTKDHKFSFQGFQCQSLVVCQELEGRICRALCSK